MSFQTITIRESIRRIQTHELVLPAIQREFVWGAGQIEQLFDSLLRGYPISTFLFWLVKAETVNRFQWYDFLRRYHERDERHNQPVVVPHGHGVTAVLDGQQRLTSLYLGLCGSYTYKLPYKQWNNNDAFPEKRLYINLLTESPNSEQVYDFRFLTKQEAQATSLKNAPCHWFKVGSILDMKEIGDVLDYVMEHQLTDTSKYSLGQGKRAKNTLSRLWQAVHNEEVISYYEERSDELNTVLQIFIRINSGGTKLSYSDLLLSIATAEWKEGNGGSARDLIHRFVDKLNSIGSGFRFDKDFVLKACLVLADLSDVRFRVDNFSTDNMQVIQERWPQIETSLLAAVELLHEFGYSGETLTATNAVIPIAYFIYFNKFALSIATAPARQDDRLRIRQWLARVLVKRTFGGQPDSLYGPLRRLIQDSPGSFPLISIVAHFRGKRKSITFSKDELDTLLDLHYGHPLTLSILTLLYLNRLNGSFRYHVDHLHPKSRFRKSDIESAGILDADAIAKVQNRVNLLANLQLLEAGANIGKSDATLADWLAGKGGQRSPYELQHFVPESKVATADFKDFLTFYEARQQMMRQELAQVLGIDLSAPDMVEFLEEAESE